MRRTILVAMLLGSAVAVTPAANAQTGILCGFVSVTDPTVEGDVQTGEIDGGPLIVEPPDAPDSDIQLICTIQVGAQGATHGGTDAAKVESHDQDGNTEPEVTYGTPGAAVIPPTQFSYVAPAGAPVYLCTQVIVNGQSRYFNETEDNATRGWSTSSSALCALAFSQEVSVPECSDGADNDFDGRTDFPNDPQCTSPEDDSELT